MSMTRLNDWLACGTNAERLAFTPTPETPAGGNSPAPRFFETDTGNDYVWNFTTSTWVQSNAGGGGGGGGALTQIQKIVTTSGQTSVELSSIPGTYNSLVLDYIMGSAYGAGAVDEMSATFNGDTAAHYNYLYLYSNGGGPAGGSAANQTAMYFEEVANGFSASIVTSGKIIFPGYALTVCAKTMLLDMYYNASGGAQTSRTIKGAWMSVSALTDIKITLSSGAAFSTGSVFILYGVN
jgi:hypothetical protein